MKKRVINRIAALCLSVMMLFQIALGVSFTAYAEEGVPSASETQEIESGGEAISSEEGGDVNSTFALPTRSPQKLVNVISGIRIVSATGVPYDSQGDGKVEFNTNGIYRYKVDFDLTKYDNDLVNGDYFTLTIPAPIHVEDQTIAFTDSTTGIEIATGSVSSNGKSSGGTATVTLKNLEAYLNKTGGETIKDVTGTFYVAFTIYEEVNELVITFETTETTNAITHTLTATNVKEEDNSELIGKTNFEKSMITINEEPFYSESLGKTIPIQARWRGRINVRQESYDSIVITDTIDLDHAPMQMIPENLVVYYGYYQSGTYTLNNDGSLTEGTDYTITYNGNYTEFVLTILNPNSRTASNGKPAAYEVRYYTSVPGDGSEVANSLKMTADDKVLTTTTEETKTESVTVVSPKSTTGGTIEIDTSYSIVLYKVDSKTLNPLPGAVFKVITPSGEEITLDATNEEGRTQSKQFTSEEAASGSFTIVEVTAPDGYILDTTPIEVTIGQSGVIKTITNKQYEATGSITLEGTKKLTGRDLKDGEFTFTVKEGTEVVATGKNDADGKITFSEIEYDLEDVGTHTYVITEDSGNISGVEYSKESYTVTVTVTDNGDGTLSANVSQPTGGIVFHNGYEAAEALVNLGAKKIYTGAALKSGMFEFELKDSNGKVVNTAKNDGDGIVSFATLRFVNPGVYKYTISEAAGSDSNITYDKTVYNVTVTVVDDGEGKLIASVDTESSNIQFRNTYTPPMTPSVPSTPSKPSTPEKPVVPNTAAK